MHGVFTPASEPPHEAEATNRFEDQVSDVNPPGSEVPGPYGSNPGGQPTPPPSGSMPPPPGHMPPAPSAGGGNPVTVGEAFNWGWSKFTQNVGQIVLGVLVYIAATAVVSGIFYAISFAGMQSGDESVFAATFSIGMLLFLGVSLLLGVLAQAAIIRVALEISYGRPVTFQTFFQFTDLGKVILAVLLVGVGTAVGSFLCYVPGLIFGFFAQFTLFFVIDKSEDAWTALKSSFALVNKNLGTVVLLYLGVLVSYFIGALLCGVGIIVALPVALLATTYVYRRLLGENVAA